MRRGDCQVGTDRGAGEVMGMREGGWKLLRAPADSKTLLANFSEPGSCAFDGFRPATLPSVCSRATASRRLQRRTRPTLRVHDMAALAVLCPVCGVNHGGAKTLNETGKAQLVVVGGSWVTAALFAGGAGRWVRRRSVSEQAALPQCATKKGIPSASFALNPPARPSASGRAPPAPDGPAPAAPP